MRIADILYYSRNRFPEKTGVVDNYRSITFSDLWHDSVLLANSLSEEYGVSKGDHISVWSCNRIECLEFIFAANLLGAVSELYNARWSEETVATLISDGSPKVAVVENGEKGEALRQAGVKTPLIVAGGGSHCQKTRPRSNLF